MLEAGLKETLAAFQGKGRWLWISGQDALDAPGPAGVADWLGLMVESGDVSATHSTAGGPLEGVTALIIGSAGANNQTTPDALSAVDDIWQPVMQWPNGQYSAFAAPGLLVLGFGLEATSGMASTTARSVFMDRCLGLLDPSWTAVDAGSPHPLPPQQTALGLLAAAPNPFNPWTRLTFQLAIPGPARLANPRVSSYAEPSWPICSDRTWTRAAKRFSSTARRCPAACTSPVWNRVDRSRFGSCC